MTKEEEKLIWMEQEFIRECRKMLDLIDKQKIKKEQVFMRRI